MPRQKKLQLQIIIPVHNEQKNIKLLTGRIDRAMRKAEITYSMIFIDDFSTDKTFTILKELSKQYPLKVYPKKGKMGKAYSILEGARLAEAEYLVMIDGDLQYPPEVIPQMFGIREEFGVIVAKRTYQGVPVLRRLFSKGFQSLFGGLLHNLSCDIQSGLKLFKREIILSIDPAEVTPWTIDLSLLKTAQDFGYQIGQIEIFFNKRRYEKSKINLIKATKEIGWNAVKLKVLRKKIYPLNPTNSGQMTGAGFFHKGEKFITHTNLNHRDSALMTLENQQKIALGILLFSICALAFVNIALSAMITLAILTGIYFIDVLFNIFVIIKSMHSKPEVTITTNQVNKINDRKLPVYTILCPLYKEAHVLPNFLASIKKLDWPKSKLEVLLLLEEDDIETRGTAAKMKLPPYIKTLIVPNSLPKTKPKACNYGLSFATGEYLVIFDAEDRPDPKQLKKAYQAFQTLSPRIACLQAKLNYYNPNQNLLTKLFTAEYSLWFDVILPGFQLINTTIPLGGTSNHFKTTILKQLRGWDPFNVTEDCDLGVRLFKYGYKTAIFNSTTFEEANSNYRNWVRQRSRWIKGYMQTYLVHMRNPIAFTKQYGKHALVFQLIIGARISFMLINPLLWIMTASYFIFYDQLSSVIESLFLAPVFYMAVFSLILGNFVYLYTYMIGCAKRGYWSLIKFVFFVPFYWVYASAAAYVAIYQLITKPHYWEKTNHGLHLQQASTSKSLFFPLRIIKNFK